MYKKAVTMYIKTSDYI